MPANDLIAAIHSGDLQTLQTLVNESPSLAAARDEAGVSALMNACYRGRHDMMEALLAAGPELDVFEAASLGKTEILRELLARDASLANVFSSDGFAPLHFAAFFGQEAIARLLLDRGADATAVARNLMRVQALHSAAATRQLGIVRLLLEHGTPVDARQQGGWTALHAAAQNGDREMVDVLLKFGADPAQGNDDGKTAASLATEKGHTELAAFLDAPHRKRAAS
jgi:uncharacterized protein